MAKQHLIPVYQAASAADVLANVRAVRARLASLDRSARIAGIEHHREKTRTVSEIMAERQRARERAEHLRQMEINKERSDAIKAAVMIEPRPILNGGLCIYQEPIGPSIIGLVPMRFVASMTNYSVHDFRGPWRSEPLTWYRQVAMWLYRTATNLSLPQIGTQFGGRDHTTVLHAFRRVNRVVGTLGFDKSTPFMTARKLIEAIDNGTFGVHTRGKGGGISES